MFQWVSLFSTYVSSTCFGPHRSIIRSVLYKLYLQIWYVVTRVLLDTSQPLQSCRNFTDCEIRENVRVKSHISLTRIITAFTWRTWWEVSTPASLLGAAELRLHIIWNGYANRVFCDDTHTLYQGVLHLRYVIRFRGTPINVITVMRTTCTNFHESPSIQSRRRDFLYRISAKQVTKNMASTGRNLFSPPTENMAVTGPIYMTLTTALHFFFFWVKNSYTELHTKKYDTRFSSWCLVKGRQSDKRTCPSHSAKT